MDGGYLESEITVDSNGVCSACGEVGHQMRTSKKCKFYVPRKKKASAENGDNMTKTQLDRDADELDLMDGIAFDDDQFFSAEEYSSPDNSDGECAMI